MNRVNRTVLIALLSQCQQLLVGDTGSDADRNPAAPVPTAAVPTAAVPTAAVPTSAVPVPVSGRRETYDNAYFYILFVMFFYFFLATTLFKNFVHHGGGGREDPYEEFAGKGPSARKFDAGPAESERFDFEEESSL